MSKRTSLSVVEKFVATGGRIFHRRESNGRIVTIAYKRTGGMNPRIQYGATIYRPNDPGEPRVPWQRRQHNETAVNRCLISPITINDSTFGHVTDREDFIRSMMHEMGASGASIRRN